MIKEVLTPDLYAALESACVSRLTSRDEDVQAAAFRLLARSLRSDAAEEWMQTRLLRALEYLELKGDVLEAPFSFQELFLLAEGLAYIDNMEGLPVLKSAAMGEDRSSSIRTRAIEAFAILGGDFSDEPLSELLMLEDALAAYAAFEYVALARPNRAVTSASVHHLVRLQRGLSKKGEFSEEELALLRRVSLPLRSAILTGGLSDNEARDTKVAVIVLMTDDDPAVQSSVASLYPSVCGDADSFITIPLLENESTEVRAYACLAMEKCSIATIRGQKDALIKLLDDDDELVRTYALFALKKGLGEVPVGAALSKSQFEAEKVRVVKAYEALRK